MGKLVPSKKIQFLKLVYTFTETPETKHYKMHSILKKQVIYLMKSKQELVKCFNYRVDYFSEVYTYNTFGGIT